MSFYSNTRALLIMTTAPTGLGHLRVMDGLEDGMPYKSNWIELGLTNYRANKIHALGSRIPLLTKITEFYQTNQLAEKILSFVYITYLRHKTSQVKQKFKSIKKTHPYKNRYVVVCTHFSLAHSIASCKTWLEKNLDVKLFLFVIVTDDSPQRVWAVNGADLIFVPSPKTKKGLLKLVQDKQILRVIPFPISPRLSMYTRRQDFLKLKKQLRPESIIPLIIQIPISGAAVQLPFIKSFVQSFPKEQLMFNIISQKTTYTKDFIEQIHTQPNVKIDWDSSARKTVKIYESVFYSSRKASLEVTKPSEQVFKALLTPKQRGGVVMLLTQPVGRQERDNIKYLRRYRLMPSRVDQTRLEYFALKKIIPLSELSSFRKKATGWRAIMLPTDPKKAVRFVQNLKESGILIAMLNYKKQTRKFIKSDGVKQFWEEVDKYLQ